jgi:hypothetical protein
LPRLPNQFYAWAQVGVPMQTYMAVPVTDASNYLEQLQPGLLSLLNSYLSRHPTGGGPVQPVHPFNFQAIWTNGVVVIPQTPFVAPQLSAVHNAAGDDLLGGLMPAVQGSKPLPPDLINEVNAHGNLVYYGWELTGQRLEQWHLLIQIWHMVFTPGPGDVTAPADKWLQAVWGKLGESGTEVKLTAPDELTLVRNSSVGLTGIELSELSYWLDAPGFPLSAQSEPPRWRAVPQNTPHSP